MTQIHSARVDQDYAPWGPRAVSWLFDIMVVDVIWWIMDTLRAIALAPLYRLFFDGPHYKVTFGIGTSYSQLGLIIAYFSIFVAMAGRTPGMARSGTRLVVRDDVTGGVPSPRRSVVRASVYLIYCLPFLTMHPNLGARDASIRLLACLVLLIVDFVITPLADAKHRTLHDLAARTVVVRLPRDGPAWSTTDRVPRRTFVKAAVSLGVLLLVVSAAVSWHERQPNPRSALGVATFLARDSSSVAHQNRQRVITTLDVQNAIHDLVAAPGADVAFDVGIASPHLVVVNVGSSHACIFVSRTPGDDARVVACPSPVPAN